MRVISIEITEEMANRFNLDFGIPSLGALDPSKHLEIPSEITIDNKMFSGALISRAISKEFGAGAIYLKQELQFIKPIKSNQKVSVTLQVTSHLTDSGYISLFTSICNEKNEVFARGEATILVEIQNNVGEKMSTVSAELEFKFCIKEYHLDSFGHVNNVAYFQILEEARWDFATACGFGHDRAMELQVGLAVLGLEISFIRELKNRESIKVKSKFTHLRDQIGIFDQQIYNERNEISCIASVTCGLFDLKERKLINQSVPDWAKLVGINILNPKQTAN